MYDRAVHRGRLVGAAAVFTAVLAVVAGCGGSSEYRYVSNGETNAYLKVPSSWTQIGHDDLVQAQAQTGGMDLVNPLDTASMLAEKMEDEGLYLPSVRWRLAFDSDTHPAMEHVLLPRNAAPVVDVLARDLTGPQDVDRRMAANVLLLENLFYYHLRLSGALDDAQLQALLERQGELGPEFAVKRDLSYKDGQRRLRLTASYRGPDEQVYVIDQTGLIDTETEHLYLLSIRSGEQEYIQNYDVLNEIATSFTVKQDG